MFFIVLCVLVLMVCVFGFNFWWVYGREFWGKGCSWFYIYYLVVVFRWWGGISVVFGLVYVVEGSGGGGILGCGVGSGNWRWYCCILVVGLWWSVFRLMYLYLVLFGWL